MKKPKVLKIAVYEYLRSMQIRRDVREIMGEVDVEGICLSFLRDMFAAYAIACVAWCETGVKDLPASVKRAYEVADLMMKERKKRTRRSAPGVAAPTDRAKKPWR